MSLTHQLEQTVGRCQSSGVSEAQQDEEVTVQLPEQMRDEDRFGLAHGRSSSRDRHRFNDTSGISVGASPRS